MPSRAARGGGQALCAETILNKVWDYEKFPTTRTIDTFMYNLRRKIEDDPAAPRHLVTGPGLGSKFGSAAAAGGGARRARRTATSVRWRLRRYGSSRPASAANSEKTPTRRSDRSS